MGTEEHRNSRNCRSLHPEPASKHVLGAGRRTADSGASRFSRNMSHETRIPEREREREKDIHIYIYAFVYINM